MLQHVFTEAHQLERLPESMIILEDLEEDKHTSIYAHCTSSNMHKCEVMLVSEIFFFFLTRAGTSILPDGKMVLYNMTTDCL